MHPILKKLGKKSLIVAPLGGDSDFIANAQKAKKSGTDLLELRIDTFSGKEILLVEAIIRKLKKTVHLPIIATVRSVKEKGTALQSMQLNENERKEIYETVLQEIDLIDIELGADKINRGLIKAAHRLGKKVILSYHDFRSVPSLNKIKKLEKKFRSLGGDIFKIAGMAKNKEQAAGLMMNCSKLKKINRIFIPMGKSGKLYRAIGFSFGSCMTYGLIDQAMAPGQISVKKLAKYRKYSYG